MRRRWLQARGGRVLAALLVLGALLVRAPLHSRLAADFPDTSPHALAHFLADFSNYPKLDTQIESWSVEAEAGNYTWWHYTVSYECGARCAGRALVWHGAGAAGDARHGAAPDHRLLVSDTRCTRLPLLLWPWFCDTMEVETTVVERAGGGSRLEESASASCGAVAALAGRCGLRALRRYHLDALRGHLL